MSPRTPTSRRSMAIVVALTAGALLMMGCGGDDEAAESTTTTAPSSDERAESDADETSTDTTDESTAGGTGSFSSADCEQLVSAFDQFDVSESLDGSSDPTEQLKEVAAQMEAAADDVPDAVAGDVRLLAEIYSQLADASADVDWEGLQSGNPAAAMGAARLGQIYAGNPEFLEASQNLLTWATENCTPS